MAAARAVTVAGMSGVAVGTGVGVGIGVGAGAAQARANAASSRARIDARIFPIANLCTGGAGAAVLRRRIGKEKFAGPDDGLVGKAVKRPFHKGAAVFPRKVIAHSDADKYNVIRYQDMQPVDGYIAVSVPAAIAVMRPGDP